jgi:hypothetical protein
MWNCFKYRMTDEPPSNVGISALVGASVIILLVWFFA